MQVARVLIVATFLVGCAQVQVEPQTLTPTSTPTPADVLSQPTIDQRFAVGADEHELALRCYGQGSPTLLFEAGTDSSGIESFPESLVRPLAETNQTCFYDRVGTGSSDPPSKPRRTLNDVVADTRRCSPPRTWNLLTS